MKKIIVLFFLQFIFLSSMAQIELINTGATVNLFPLTVIGNTVIINGAFNYLVKSNDECDNLLPLTVPVPANYFNIISRPDNNNLYMLSTLGFGSQTVIHKSTDEGQSWVQKFTNSGSLFIDLKFFDANEGISTGHYVMLRTKDGGNSWIQNTSPNEISTKLEVYDSLACLGGGEGSIRFSKDRGYTWSYAVNTDHGSPSDFFFLNGDTIFGVALPGYSGAIFVKSTNGGMSWQVNYLPQNYSPTAVHFKNAKEGYIIGHDANDSLGLILKTTDLGQTWASFKTSFKADLRDIAFLNDSTALISGTNGLLLKWSLKQTIFTGIKDYSKEDLAFKIFPNPVKDKLSLQFENTLKVDVISISNALGQVVYSMNDPQSKQEIDLGFLQSGIYFLTLRQAQGENKTGQKIFKVVKE